MGYIELTMFLFVVFHYVWILTSTYVNYGVVGSYSNLITQVDAESIELFALKGVVSCITNFKLESELPLDRFIARIKELEDEKEQRASANGSRKRAASSRPSSTTPRQEGQHLAPGHFMPGAEMYPVGAPMQNHRGKAILNLEISWLLQPDPMSV